MYSICNMTELSNRNFCCGLERKFASRLGGIQQAGSAETAAKSVTPRFIFG